MSVLFLCGRRNGLCLRPTGWTGTSSVGVEIAFPIDKTLKRVIDEAFTYALRDLAWRQKPDGDYAPGEPREYSIYQYLMQKLGIKPTVCLLSASQNTVAALVRGRLEFSGLRQGNTDRM